MATVEEGGEVRIERLETAPFGTNAYVIVCKATGDSVLIDAPGEPDRIRDVLKATTPTCILITHGHMDHTMDLAELAETLRVPVGAHEADEGSLPVNIGMPLKDGSVVAFGDTALTVLHTPGHTQGSLCFLIGDCLISGDTLFPGGPGKTGSPAALQQIIESIRGKIFVLPDDTRVYPGHGDPTVLGKEKEEYADFASRSHDPNLCGDVLWLSS